VQDSLYLDDFANFLAQNKYTATVLGALGEFNNKRSREILADYINSSSEKLRFITARSLKKIKADKLLKQMQDDDSFLVRTLVKKYFSKRN
jgi:HEAT repeat protein